MSSESQIGVRIPDTLRAKLKEEAQKHDMSEPGYIRTLLEHHFRINESKKNEFITYENFYLKIILDRTLYNTYMIMEHLKASGNPEWDAKGYHSRAAKRAYESQDFAHEEAMSILGLREKEKEHKAPEQTPEHER